MWREKAPARKIKLAVESSSPQRNMSIVPQQRRSATNLRIAIWTAFLIVLVLPLLFDRSGHPYYGALLLRPAGWILGRATPRFGNYRALTILNFFLYAVVIYAILRLLRRNRQSQ
jgi:hypothetical protein